MSKDEQQGGKVKKPYTKKQKAAHIVVFLIMFVGIAFAVLMYTDFTATSNQTPTIHIPQELQDRIDAGEFGDDLNSSPIQGLEDLPRVEGNP